MRNSQPSAFVALVGLIIVAAAAAFLVPNTRPRTATPLKMVTDKPPPKKLSNIEGIKVKSNYLRDPLDEEMKNEEIFVTGDAVQVLKYHGSYMQDNRENRKPGQQKDYQFMLRLKTPCGEVPANLYLVLDEIATKYGQNDLRATTRQAWQIHGIIKGDLRTVMTTIMKAGSSTVGACGDVSRNVMTTPAPIVNKPEYDYARTYSKIFAELFKPQSQALSEVWLGDEKISTVEYWKPDIIRSGVDINKALLKDNGHGIIVSDPVEPLYGQTYLPRKFKVAVTVPGDNSIDVYTNDIGLVVITDSKGELEGFNVMVGGGMGRTHNKESTFARAADHLGFVSKDDVLELCKAIVATQRDHGNREVRANARMKYLVHNKGIDGFRELVEGYFGKKIEPWRPMAPWRYSDWLGWHEQGDGKWFLGVNVEQGRIKDDGSFRLRTALRKLVKDYNMDMILTPSQSIILKDILEKDKSQIEAILRSHGVKMIEQVDPLVRLSMACPALPLCGLAITEAERRMPECMDLLRGLVDKLGLEGEEFVTRMTGCPNGCARPYMAELGLVGDGPDSYQVWLGGSPVQTRTAYTFKGKVKYNELISTLEPIFVYFRDSRKPAEAFGDFCHRVGSTDIEAYCASYAN